MLSRGQIHRGVTEERRFRGEILRMKKDEIRPAISIFRLRGEFGIIHRVYCGRQVISTRTGISFFTAMVRSDGGSILKSDNVAGIVPEMRVWFP